MTASLQPSTRRAEAAAAGVARTRIWDLPTRIFHWALAIAVVGQIVTGLSGIMEWHFRVGYCVLALLSFRLVWGFVGGRWSRFASFIYAPGSVAAYLRGRAPPEHLVGHSPLGALSVFALLALLMVQVATGLVSDDEISASGPLTRFVSGAVVSAASHWHAVPGKWLLIVLASVHVVAVLFYVLFRRQRLVGPMIGGDKMLARDAAVPSRDDAASRLLALALFVACAAFAAWIASLRT